MKNFPIFLSRFVSYICHRFFRLNLDRFMIISDTKSRKYFPMNRFFIALFLTISAIFTYAASDGAKIFKQNCAVCHSIGDQRLTGPGMAGIAARVPDDVLLTAWVKNNNKVLASGNPYFKNLYKEYAGAAMTVFEGVLTDEDITAVVAYIKNPPLPPTVTTSTSTTTGTPDPVKASGIDPLYLLLGGISLLLILFGLGRNIRLSLQNVYNKKNGLEETEDKGFFAESKEWISGHRKLVGVGFLVISLLGMRGCWNALWEIGVYEGYKPEQPIKFSHTVHAGENKIACQYCHNSVEKSKHAGIPTVNICMNCHKGIQEGPSYGKKEIGKIHFAAGFNTKTNAYDLPTKPIKWIKVHNLPDHVYFNHQQHVVVGKQECKTCHGEVEKMTVAQQVKPLTMGWCIDCHRKTEVAMEGNAYYDKLHAELAKKYKGQKAFTVAEAGGIECAKCHY
jgi:cytochrome c2